MTLVAVALAFVAGAPDSPEPVTAYWERRPGCERGFTNGQARSGLRRVLHQLRPLSAAEVGRVRDWRVCAKTRAGRRGTERLARKLRRWRLAYGQVWPIRFHRLPAWSQGWAWRTGACESGNNPRTSTGNGFYGAFQWVPSTWWAAGGDRWPTLASWWHQATLAVGLMLREGAGHWPVCGR